MSSYTPAPLSISPGRIPSSPTSPSSDGGSGRSFSTCSEDYLLAMSSPTQSDRKLSLSGSRPKPQKVNANSYCGRHSDEYLFGPIANSASRMWHSMKKKD